MKNNNPNASGYVYGNAAYDYEKQREVIRQKPPLEEQKPKPIKKKSKKSKVKAKLRILSIVGMLFVMSFIAVGRYTAILTLSTDIRTQKTEVKKVQKENQNISVELAKFNNLKYIENDAIMKYNMIRPSDTHFIDVKPLSSNVTKSQHKESALTTVQRILGLIY
ncbi:MAG: septum formation initiator family protein [Clostridium sp.]